MNLQHEEKQASYGFHHKVSVYNINRWAAREVMAGRADAFLDCCVSPTNNLLLGFSTKADYLEHIKQKYKLTNSTDNRALMMAIANVFYCNPANLKYGPPSQDNDPEKLHPGTSYAAINAKHAINHDNLDPIGMSSPRSNPFDTVRDLLATNGWNHAQICQNLRQATFNQTTVETNLGGHTVFKIDVVNEQGIKTDSTVGNITSI